MRSFLLSVVIGVGWFSAAQADPSMTCGTFTQAMQAGSRDNQMPYLIEIGRDAGADAVSVEPDGTDIGERFDKTSSFLLAGVVIECSGSPNEGFDDALKAAMGSLVESQVANDNN